MENKPNYDKSLESLRQIKNEFSKFCNSKGKVTEADTWRLVIDRILTEVLCWPTSKIECEKHEKAKTSIYLDYIYKYNDKNSIIVEAKKEGISFDLPENIATTRLKVSSLLKDNKSELSTAIEQTWDYCANNGSDFGITTNGYSWIIFKAITSGEKWREREAIVFKSLEDIIIKFQLFWDLLSVDSINNFSLEKQLPSITLSERENLLNELSEYFNIDKYSFHDRLLERAKKYDGKEIPIAKPELTPQN